MEGFHAFPTLHSYQWWELTGTGAGVCYRNSPPGLPNHNWEPQPQGQQRCAHHCAWPGVSPGPWPGRNLRPRLLPSPIPELESPSPHPTVWGLIGLEYSWFCTYRLCDLWQLSKPFWVSRSLSVKRECSYPPWQVAVIRSHTNFFSQKENAWCIVDAQQTLATE